MFKLEAIIEIPKTFTYKYEMDKENNTLILDRPLNQEIPHNYGFIPNTYCGDGDPLDVFVISKYAILPLTKVKVDVIGVLKCTDNGEEDDKLIGVLCGEKDHDLQAATRHIRRYLSTYKKGFKIKKFYGVSKAKKVYESNQEPKSIVAKLSKKKFKELIGD